MTALPDPAATTRFRQRVEDDSFVRLSRRIEITNNRVFNLAGRDSSPHLDSWQRPSCRRQKHCRGYSKPRCSLFQVMRVAAGPRRGSQHQDPCYWAVVMKKKMFALSMHAEGFSVRSTWTLSCFYCSCRNPSAAHFHRERIKRGIKKLVKQLGKYFKSPTLDARLYLPVVNHSVQSIDRSSNDQIQVLW